MAHLLENATSMMYVGETPWHGLGVEVQGENGVCTVEQAVAAVPTLNSGVEYSQALAMVGGQPVSLPDTFAVVRSLDSKVVGVVGNQASQSNASPARLMATAEQLLSGRDVPGVSTAGFLRDGSVMWVALGLGQHTLTNAKGEKDTTNYYFNLSTAFDGSMATGGQITSVRVVCNNTLSLARRSFGDNAADVRVKHTKNHESNLINATEVWAAALKEFELFKSRIDALAACPINEAQAVEVVKTLFGVQNKEKIPTRTQNNIDKVLSYYQGGGMGADGWQGTAYGLLQACTQYSSHDMTVRGARTEKDGIVDGQADKILDSVLFGNAAAFATNAFETLVALTA